MSKEKETETTVTQEFKEKTNKELTAELEELRAITQNLHQWANAMAPMIGSIPAIDAGVMVALNTLKESGQELKAPEFDPKDIDATSDTLEPLQNPIKELQPRINEYLSNRTDKLQKEQEKEQAKLEKKLNSVKKKKSKAKKKKKDEAKKA